MLKCSTSLWSADLSNLGSEIRRVEPYSERFHLDVADGHYVNALLFFPDLVKALRKHTYAPFEVNLLTVERDTWLSPVVAAGADRLISSFAAVPDPAALIAKVKAAGKQVGFALRIDEPIDLIARDWEPIDTLCVIGTALGIKGATMGPGVPGKIQQARQIIDTRGL